MSAVKLCVICNKPLDDGERRRSDAVTCSRACRTALWRARRKVRREGGGRFVRVTRDSYGSAASFEPPASPTASFLVQSRADDRFRAQLVNAAAMSQPLSPEEEAAVAWQRRNPGVLHPLMAQRLDADAERREREAAETSHQPVLKPENPLDPASLGSLAIRARYDRMRNRPADPHLSILRSGPGRSGPPSWYDDSNECLDKASIGWG